MSIRQMFPGSIVQPGLNPLVAPTSGTYKELYSWGGNTTGKIGDSTTDNKSSPVQIGSSEVWASLNNAPISSLHTGAIKNNGTLWMWGDGGGGKLGLGNTTNYSSPKQVGALTNWLQVATGYQSSAAIKTDGTLWTWGFNGNGVLGLGNLADYSSPKQVGSLTNWAWTAVGVFAMGGVKTDGTLWMWGGGQGFPVLGLGNLTYYSSPKQVGSLTNWLKVYVGQYACLAVKTNGTLWSWGNNNYGQLGLGNTTQYNSPKQIGALTNWLKGAANGYSSAVFVKTDGTLWGWGLNNVGQIGLGNTTNYSSPKQVGSLTTWSDVKIGYANAGTFALKTDGTIWSWGSNSVGQLGLGNTINYSSPKQIGSSTSWTVIGNAGTTIQAIKTGSAIPPPYTQYSGIWTMQQVNAAIAAGTWPQAPVPHLYSWGVNGSGQLGLGNTFSKSSPNQVGTATWSQVSAGSYNSFAIKPDGTLWSWGSNASGALGLGNTTYYSSPKQVGSLTNWSVISGKSSIALAIKSDGTLWSWGANTYGQLGINNTTSYSSPVQIGALTTWSKTSAGGSYGIAIKTDGTIWSWGRNTFGQLGLNVAGAGYSYSSPKQIGSLTNWASVSASPFGSVSAIKTDGTLWSWGGNNYGELGDGTITQRNSPVQIGALTNWMTVACGSYACIAVKTDGTLWTWGLGGNGQLGTGNTTSRSSPVQVGALTTWAYGSSSVQFFMGAVKTDGTLWTWGYNNQGQLGLGNITYYSSPKQVGALTAWSTFSMGDSHTIAIATTV